ncbi:MAG: hypothetical protein AB8G11_18005 [Saprospiraceae bacterium]
MMRPCIFKLAAIRDSIVYDLWTPEDYNKKPITDLVGYFSFKFIINDDGYQTLMNHIDKLPLEYETILQDLRNLYIKEKTNIIQANNRLVSVHYEAVDELYEQDWYLPPYSEEKNKNRSSYYMSSGYKKYILSYMNDRGVLLDHSQNFQVKAVETYLRIDSLLNNTKSTLPKEYLTTVTEEEYGQYMGFYGTTDSTFISKMYIQNDELYSLTDSLVEKHHKINDNLFIVFDQERNNDFYIWKFTGNDIKDYRIEILAPFKVKLTKLDK